MCSSDRKNAELEHVNRRIFAINWQLMFIILTILSSLPLFFRSVALYQRGPMKQAKTNKRPISAFKRSLLFLKTSWRDAIITYHVDFLMEPPRWYYIPESEAKHVYFVFFSESFVLGVGKNLPKAKKNRVMMWPKK
mmetsp:Transcript_13579/g.20039  ORF Transcript_13579/g.20039 Transcript_13579/m.20039 type:complete len:136 (+) Transcript_13579:100-507(+)